MPATLRPLADQPLNTNYDPPRPWACATHAAHHCSGPVGFVGAYPVCSAGSTAELAAAKAEAARIEALMADPAFRRVMAQEARIERYLETRYA